MTIKQTDKPFHGFADEGISPEDWIYITWHRRKWYKKMAWRIRKLFPLERGKVLDIGCGDGRLLHELRPLYSLGVSMQGVDLEVAFVDYAKGKYQNHNQYSCAHMGIKNSGNLHFALTDGSLKDVKNGPFDLIIAQYLCHHWKNPQDFFRALLPHMATGGMAYILDLNPESWLNKLMSQPLLYPIIHYNRASYTSLKHSLSNAYTLDFLLESLDKVPGILKRGKKMSCAYELIIKKISD